MWSKFPDMWLHLKKYNTMSLYVDVVNYTNPITYNDVTE